MKADWVVVVEQPNGQTVGPAASVAVSARVIASDGGTAPGTLPSQMNWRSGTLDGVLTQQGSTPVYRASTMMAASTTGPVAVLAGWFDGGPVGDAGYRVDATPPTLTVTIVDAGSWPYGAGDGGWAPADVDFAASLPAGTPVFRRDETIRFRVTSSDSDVDGGSLIVGLDARLPDGGALSWTAGAPQACAGNGSGLCAEFDAKLSNQAMPSFRANATGTASVSDVYGNKSAKALSMGFGVTRWKWARLASMNIGTTEIRASPVVGDGGVVYVGRNYAGANGGLVAVTPDGASSVVSTVGPVVASPSIGRSDTREWVFYETTSSAGITVLDGATPKSCGAAGSGNVGSLAVVNDGTLSVQVVGGFDDSSAVSGKRLALFKPSTGCGIMSADTAVFKGVAPAGNIVVSGQFIWVANVLGSIERYQVALSLTELTPFAVGAGNLYGISLVTPPSGTRLVGGAGTAGAGRLFVSEDSNWAPVGFNISKHVGGAAITADGGTLYAVAEAVDAGDATGRLCRFGALGDLDPINLSPEILPFKGSPEPGATTPVLGQDGGIYVVSSNGAVLAAQQGTLSTSWIQSLPSQGVNIQPGELVASPTLDCNWERPGTGTGILYFATGTGWLVAYIVDSPGLDRTAAWPKYQHDVRNTGNSTVPIDPCP